MSRAKKSAPKKAPTKPATSKYYSVAKLMKTSGFGSLEDLLEYICLGLVSDPKSCVLYKYRAPNTWERLDVNVCAWVTCQPPGSDKSKPNKTRNQKVTYVITGSYDTSQVNLSEALDDLRNNMDSLRAYGEAECELEIPAGKLKLD